MIDAMEDCFDQPFQFVPDLIEARNQRGVSAIEPGHWDYGISIYGKARKYRASPDKVPTLNSTLYGFASDQEYFRVQAYLKTHAGYQLGLVSAVNRHLGNQLPAIYCSLNIWSPVLMPILQLSVRDRGSSVLDFA